MLRAPRPGDGHPPHGADAIPAARPGDGVRAGEAPQLQHPWLRPPLQPRRARRRHVLQLPAPVRLRRPQVHRGLHQPPPCRRLIEICFVVAAGPYVVVLTACTSSTHVRTYCRRHTCMECARACKRINASRMHIIIRVRIYIATYICTHIQL